MTAPYHKASGDSGLCVGEPVEYEVVRPSTTRANTKKDGDLS